MDKDVPTIAVLGASGLIGGAVAQHLLAIGVPVLAVARRFTAAQKAAFGAGAVETPVVALDPPALRQVLAKADIVINCIGVLQDGPRGDTADVHSGFVARLLEALAATGALLIHLSIPGSSDGDATSFSRSKRAAEGAIAAGAVPSVILRPGMVIAPGAYGGSALIRALAVLPFDLSRREAGRPFAVTAIGDLARTVVLVVTRWRAGARSWHVVWDVMALEPSTVGDVLDGFRKRLGGPVARLVLPSWIMTLGARLGDFASVPGWAPPIRSTALREMRRGVEGDPAGWIAATGIRPASLSEILQALPVTIQETWFARLYLAKALIVVTLVMFWDVSAVIALSAFGAAAAILTAHGFALWQANAVTLVSSLADMSVGIAIAFRRTARRGLMAGIGLSLFYMASAAVITPELWLEPLGALVKTGPAIVLMLAALAILEDR
ncbi:MAG: SDR family oxidoreductase [Rhizomicrobium sp.]